MKWVAPSEKDSASATLEKRLWDAADQFRANSGLKPQEYSGPILGLIFLRFAEVRYKVQHTKLANARPTGARSRADEPTP
jgi:type I restriction enzyme M protein